MPKSSKDREKSSFTRLRRTLSGIMFLDIKGFSKLEEVHLQILYDNVLPGLAALVKGHEHSYVNTWGDAIVVASGNIRELALLAAAIRDMFRNFDWQSKLLPELTVRISLHLGSMYVGEDLFSTNGFIIGRTINLAARIEPITRPGEIWATRDFIDLLKREQQLRLRWSSVGPQELPKDAGVEELFVIYREHEPDPDAAPKEVAVAVVVRGKQVLLVHRIDGAKPIWQFPAGQIKPGTDPARAAVREVREETNIACNISKKISQRLHPDTKVMCHYYLCNYVEGKEENLDTSENDQVEWVGIQEALTRFTTNIDPVVRQLLDDYE